MTFRTRQWYHWKEHQKVDPKSAVWVLGAGPIVVTVQYLLVARRPKGLRERSRQATKFVCWKVSSGFGPHFLLQKANKGSRKPYWLSKRPFDPYFDPNLSFFSDNLPIFEGFFSKNTNFAQKTREFFRSSHISVLFDLF